MAHRFSGPGKPYEGLTRLTDHGPKWTGDVRLVPEILDQPLRWRKPRRIFVCSMSDLFHEEVPDEFIDRVWAVMAESPRHTFQVLTKRAKRMREYVQGRPGGGVLPNAWLGVSVENQKAADHRIRFLLQTPAALRFVSAEPLLGPLQLGDDSNSWLTCNDPRDLDSEHPFNTARECCESAAVLGEHFHGIDWVIVGGESGPGARDCDAAWVRNIIGDCRAAKVPVFVKQLGKRARIGEGTELPNGERLFTVNDYTRLNHPKGGAPVEWPEDLRVREWPK